MVYNTLPLDWVNHQQSRFKGEKSFLAVKELSIFSTATLCYLLFLHLLFIMAVNMTHCNRCHQARIDDIFYKCYGYIKTCKTYRSSFEYHYKKLINSKTLCLIVFDKHYNVITASTHSFNLALIFVLPVCYYW